MSTGQIEDGAFVGPVERGLDTLMLTPSLK